MRDLKAFLIITVAALALPICSLAGLARGAESQTKADVLLDVIENRPRWWEDAKEDPEERKARLSILSQEIIAASSGAKGFSGSEAELVALITTAGFWESRYNSRIHKGNCRPTECDKGRSRSPFQLKPRKFGGVVPNSLWERIAGAGRDSDRAATQGAALAFTAAWKACKHRQGVRGVFGAYGRGRCSSQYQVIRRERTFRKILAEYREGLGVLARDPKPAENVGTR